ncbi:peptidoglycan recognition protein family protein [Actinacidiphila paucisporea]|uniref:peptidoglycan recognition protein family protein n=1 Tax=Actinacidiphila paucisporea TaxID=310782 RepID=UPI00093592E0|nr:peptidoglycan recognition protein [Actinacidiphila paucisporea]
MASSVHTVGLAVSSDGSAVLGRRGTDPFSTVGVSWRDPKAAGPARVEVRTRDAGTGAWSGWHQLDASDPVAGLGAGARGATEPLWVGPSDGVQVQVDGGAGALPAGLRVDMVGDAPSTGGTQAAVAPRDTPRPPGTGPASSVPQPTIVNRAGWGADESISPEDPVYMDDVHGIFVHHTDGAVDYDCADSPSIIRGIYAYHVQTEGWKDIGYNFLVDKCGTVFEGRKGGVDQPVEGAHTAGWNQDTAGIAVLGTYTSVSASNAALTSIARVAAWKLGQYGVDPSSTVTLTTQTTQTSGTGRTFTAGQSYPFAAISAHRDGVATECPGDMLYAQLGTIRSYAAGPVAGLAVSSVSGAAYLDGGTYHTTGPATVNWTTSTPSSLISAFKVLVDGTAATTVAGTARSATVTLPVGTHAVSVQGIHQSGKAATSAATTVVADAPPPATTFHPLTPTRLMDTRYGTGAPKGAVGPGGVVSLPVTGGSTGVPASGVTAVVLNVTATGPTASSYLSVYPDGTARTSASNLNFTPGQTIPNLVVVPVVNGKVDFYNHGGSVNVIADVTGYYTADTTGSTYRTLTPTRLMDTRYGTGVRKGAVGPGGVVSLPVTGGSTGVPASGVTAVVLNVTATGPTASSFVSVYPDGTARTSASNLNFTPGQTIPNLVVVPVVNGKVDFYNHGGSVNLIADISGYYTSATTGAKYSNLGPRRLMDTRSGIGVRTGKVGPGALVSLPVTGDNGVPVSGVTAVVLNVTATGPTASSFVSVYPDGTTRTSASNLNFVKGETIPNLVVVPVVNGKVDFWNAYGTVDLIADIMGYYTG